MQSPDESGQQIDLLHAKVRTMMEAAMPEHTIIEVLVAEGHSEYYARTVMDNIRQEKNHRKTFNNTLLLGTGITAVGVLLNVVSYNTAEASNATFFYVFRGIVALGISLVLRAFILYRK